MINRRFWVFSALAAWGTAVAAGSTAVLAAEGGRVIEEIIVTATYRETSLMDTAQSINALDESVITEMGAQDMGELFQQIPGLNMTGTTTGANRFTVRGITSQTGTSFQNYTLATIGIYLDNTPVTSALGPAGQMSGNMFDIKRVEVLKGPQGTLFGEGSQGGTIRYLYNQPQTEEVEFGMNLGASQMSGSGDYSHRVDAMVNVPLSDTVALRVVGFDTETAGYIDNLDPPQKDFNPQRSTGGRMALKYEANEWLDLTGTVTYIDAKTQGTSMVVRPFEIDLPPFPGIPPASSDELALYNLLAEASLGWADFTSSTSYLERDSAHATSVSATTVFFYDFYAAFSFALVDPTSPVPVDGLNSSAGINDISTSVERFVQEFRLVSSAENRLRWTAGLFYKDSTDRTDGLVRMYPAPGREQYTAVVNDFFLTPVNNHTDTLTEYAAFGEVSYDLTDTLELTAGARVSRLEQEIGNVNATTKDTPVSPKVVLAWRPADDLLAYASYTTGFRPGNGNQPLVFYIIQNQEAHDLALAAGNTALAADFQYEVDRSKAHLTFTGDEVSSYELGVKSTFWDGRAQLAASAYYLDWKDMIQFYVDPDPIRVRGGNFSYNDNAGSASSKGLELELTALVTDGLTLRLAGDVNKSELGASTSAGTKGNDLVFAPRHSFAVILDYTLPIGDRWAATFHVDQAWVAKQYQNANNTFVLPKYRKTNARITLREATQDKWRVILFAKNLTNEKIQRQFQTSAFDPGVAYSYYDNPRQVGLEFAWRM